MSTTTGTRTARARPPSAHPHENAQPERGSEITDLLNRSGLDAEVKARAAELFWRLAEAEATVHGARPESVHFHEVGRRRLHRRRGGRRRGPPLVARRSVRLVAPQRGHGHGDDVPWHVRVPPPATARLVTGAPVYGAGEGELLTPTGALLVTSFASSYGPLPLLRPEGIGHGAGTRDTHGRPNVLRLIVGEEDAPPATTGWWCSRPRSTTCRRSFLVRSPTGSSARAPSTST